MAVVANPLEKDREKELEQAVPGQPKTIGQSTGAAVPNSAGAGPAPNAPTSSGRFTNIQRYLKAQGPSGVNLGNQITNKIEQSGQKAVQNINQAQTGFQNQANANRIQYDSKLVNQALADPTKFAGDQNQMQNFARLRDATYGGPREIQEMGQLQAQTQGLQRTAAQAGTEAGRHNLLRQMFARPTYSAGQQRLDSVLLQSDPRQLARLNAARQIAGGVNTQLQQAQNSASGLVQQYGQEAQQAQNLTRAALTDKTTAESAAIDAKVAQAQKERDALVARLTSSAQAQAFSADDLKRLGLSAGMETYDLNLGNYLGTNKDVAASRQNVASAEDYARMNALAQLAGQQGATEFANKEAAGMFFKDQATFDKNRFLQDVAGRKAAFESTYNPLMAQDQALYGQIAHLGGGHANNAAINRAEWLRAITAQGQEINDEDRQLLNTYNQWRDVQNQRQALIGQYGIGRKIQQS